VSAVKGVTGVIWNGHKVTFLILLLSIPQTMLLSKLATV